MSNLKKYRVQFASKLFDPWDVEADGFSLIDGHAQFFVKGTNESEERTTVVVIAAGQWLSIHRWTGHHWTSQT